MTEPGGEPPLPVDADLRERILGFALRMSGDRHLAEDVAQETLARALQPGTPRDLPYLFRIALNLVRTERRRETARRTAATDALHLVVDRRAAEPLAAVAAREEAMAFWSAMGELTEKERTALLLRHRERLTCADLGRVLGISPNAVSCLLHRAKDRLLVLLARRSPTR